MHKYLKALGFDNIQTRSDLKKLLEEVEEQCTHQTIVSYKPGEDFCELKKEYGQSMGIALCGGLDEREYFDPYYYFPYFEGSGISTYAEIAVERKIEKEQYLGMCEDSKIGISLIFTVQNGIEYMRERQAGFPADPTTSVTLSGLALSGMILLPVSKDEKSVRSEKEASDNRKMLINAARNGDQSAIETLTLDDIDMYSQVSKRLANEDIFSIVDTYFMPLWNRVRSYSIMGEILAVRRRKNIVTNREVYQMKLNVNELQLIYVFPYPRRWENLRSEGALKERYGCRDILIFNMNNRRKSRKAHYGIIFCFRVSINAEIAEAAGIVRTIPNVPHSP